MTISKRINDRRKMRRSKKGGVKFNQGFQGNFGRPKFMTTQLSNNAKAPTQTAYQYLNTAPDSIAQEHIVVILCKLAGDVPAKANELSTKYGNAPIYFGWCPFNVQHKDPYDLIQKSENITTLRNWRNVDHTNFEQSVILERWSGVTTDSINSSACINYLHTITDVTWPKLKLPKKIVPPYSSKQYTMISDFYMKRIAYLLNYDITKSTDFFTTFLKRFVSRVDGGLPIFESFKAMKVEMDIISDPDPEEEEAKKKIVLDKWAMNNGNSVFKIYFDGLDATAMRVKVFELLEKINTVSGTYVKADSIQQNDLDAVYGKVYKVLPITEMFCKTLTLSYRLDNFFKHWIDESPKEPPLVTTDGCAAMVVVAIDILQQNPTNSDTQTNYMLEMATYDSCGLREWSAKRLKPLLQDNLTTKSRKCLHVILDMEADDLFALRIFAKFYSRIVVYIASNIKDDNVLFNILKTYLETNKPEYISIDPNPVVCHTLSPNPKAIVGHYQLLYEHDNTKMGDIIRHINPKSPFLPQIEKPSLVAAPAPIEVGPTKDEVVPIEVAPMVNDMLRDESEAVVGLPQMRAKISQEELTDERETAARDADENFGGSKRKKSKKSRRSRRSRRSRTSRSRRSISRRSKRSKEN